MTASEDRNGCKVKCTDCDGAGITNSGGYSSGDVPDECTTCFGSGHVWKYESGALAKWYGGPLIGRDS